MYYDSVMEANKMSNQIKDVLNKKMPHHVTLNEGLK